MAWLHARSAVYFRVLLFVVAGVLMFVGSGTATESEPEKETGKCLQKNLGVCPTGSSSLGRQTRTWIAGGPVA